MQINKPLRRALILSTLVITAILLLNISAQFSKEKRAAAQKQYLQKQLAQVAPSTFDNNPGTDAKQLKNGNVIYPFYKNQQLLGYAIATTTADGYSGDIRLLIGIDTSGVITAVYPLSHHETPGLGDRIEPRHSNWIDGFIGMNKNTPLRHWKTLNNGGHFDNLTGASVTADAILTQVRKTLDQGIK